MYAACKIVVSVKVKGKAGKEARRDGGVHVGTFLDKAAQGRPQQQDDISVRFLSEGWAMQISGEKFSRQREN